jgi:hypothetical protein
MNGDASLSYRDPRGFVKRWPFSAGLLLLAACPFTSEPVSLSHVTLLVTNPNCSAGVCAPTPVMAVPPSAHVTPGGLAPTLTLGIVTGPSACLVFPDSLPSTDNNGFHTVHFTRQDEFELAFSFNGLALVMSATTGLVAVVPGRFPGWSMGGTVANPVVSPAGPCS